MFSFQEGRNKEEIRDRKKEEYRYGKMRELLDDFPNLKVGGLLPDPNLKEKKVMVTETQEWTVVVFPRGQGHWRRVIRLDSTFNQSPLRQNMCGEERSVGQRGIWSSPSVDSPKLLFEFLPSPYEQLPDLSCFDSVEIIVESSNVSTNKSVNHSNGSPWLPYFPPKMRNCFSLLMSSVTATNCTY